MHPVTLDIRASLTYVFRSRRWPIKLVIAACCILFFWLLVIPAMLWPLAIMNTTWLLIISGLAWLLLLPLFLFLGYSLATARAIRGGAKELPSWRGVWRKLLDGLRLGVVLAIWTLPVTQLSVLSPPVDRPPLPGYAPPPFDGLGLLGLVWAVFLAVFYPAIWCQYITGGFVAAFNLAQLVRRVRAHARLTIATALLGLIVALIGAAGLAVVGVGLLLTMPYASFVQAHLFGQYARLTDSAASRGAAGRATGHPSDGLLRRLAPRFAVRALVVFVAVLPVLSSLAPVIRTAAAAAFIDFEDLATTGQGQGGQTRVTTQYVSRGVTFNDAYALDYSKGVALPGFAHSGTKAIEHCYGVEFCSAPIEMSFAPPTRRIKVWVGYSYPLNATSTVVLTALDSNGTQLGIATTTFPASASPRPIQTPLEVTVGSASIVRARVNFSNTIYTSGLAVDDVEFDQPGVPVCTATANPSSGAAPLTVQFQASASNGTPGYTYSWAFGDGGSATGKTASHTYTRSGIYSAILTAVDAASKSCARSLNVQVSAVGDTTPPIVRITDPTDGQALATDSLGRFRLAGEIIEDGSLASLQVQVTSPERPTPSGPSALTFTGPNPPGAPDYTFDTPTVCCLAFGQNTITVRAADSAGHVGEASVSVTREQVTLDITIAAVEVTQAVQYAHPLNQTCLNTHDPCTLTLQNNTLPLVRGKDIALRVYPKILGSTGGPISNVGAVLSFSKRGETRTQVVRPMNTLGSTARITITPSRTLTEMRRDLLQSWNFLIPASETNTEQLTLDIAVNPYSTEGDPVVECQNFLDCRYNNAVRVLVPLVQPKTITIRTVKIAIREADGSVTSVAGSAGADANVEQMRRYLQQVYPMRVVFQDGGTLSYTRSELIDGNLGITGPFTKSVRGGTSEAYSGVISLIPHLIGSLGSQSAEAFADTVDQVGAIANCYVSPEPDTYILGLAPIGDGSAKGLGFPPIHFYIMVPVPGPWYAPWDVEWKRIDVASLECHTAWATIGGTGSSIPPVVFSVTPTIAPQEVGHNLELGPGHLSCDHGEQDLGWISTLLNITAKVAGVLTGNIALLAAFVDLPIRCEPDTQHGGIREFGLDMRSPNGWRVLDPSRTTLHDFMSYGGNGVEDWISPLTYYRLTQKNP